MTLLNNPKYDVESIRRDFPVLAQKVNGKPLVFLDNAASAQKPHQVIDAMKNVLENEYANVHRGLYSFSEKCTERFENARKKVQKFINADSESEIVFVRGATEAINLVASSYGSGFLKEGDEVIISEAEHHSNIVPWQMLRDEKGLVLKVAPVSDDGDFLIDEYQKLLTERTKLVAIAHMSNVLGSIFPVREIIKMAHDVGAKVLLDGCQAITHTPVDVKELDCDFYAFSGHKIYAPTGIGVLYGKKELLEIMPPYQGGGEMMKKVTFEKTTYAESPAKFEA
ncbi:MAG: aminotransferase class V-fold PLP-dependent enzyme, partial [Alphaproteobacteria bacterium]|nr:aminotransferase class V-fold PLP-dependent enzyme [Alphaproteobacteria bacterium]